MHNEHIIQFLRDEKHLSNAEIKEFLETFESLSYSEKSYIIYEMVGKQLYKEYPVDIKTFIHDPYFLGNIYSDIIFPIWEETLVEMYPAPFCKKYNEALLSCATRCFAKGTKVRMFDGSVKNIEDIKVGEQVMGPDSQPRTVLQLTHGTEEMYKVTPSKGGNSFVCNKSHRLALKVKHGVNDSKESFREMTVEDYIKRYGYSNKRTFMYRPQSPITFGKTVTPTLDPYFLGLWLADGRKDRVSISGNYKDIEIEQYLRNLATYYSAKIIESNIATNSRDINIVFNGENRILKELKRLNVYKNKHIPHEVLLYSPDDRYKFIAGYIDGDGTVIHGTLDNFSITTSKDNIASGLVNIIKSLGMYCSCHIRDRLDKRTNKVYHSNDLILGGNPMLNIPTLLPRKRVTTPRRYDWNKFGFTIEPVGVDDFYGFTIDRDHKFLLEDYTVVLNSGKSTVIVISALYEIYLLLCMVSPSKTLNIKNSANITFVFLSKDNPTACSQLGEDVHKGLTLSPYFIDVITNNLSFSNLDKKGVQVTDNILLKAGSTVNVITGTDLIFGCLDEANMPSPKISAEQLVETRTKLYTAMVDRRNATFSKAPAMTGMIWLTSSPMDEGDVIGERIDVVRSNGIENVFIMDDIPRWVARNESMDDTFDFFLGSNVQDPCIIEESDVDRDSLPEDKIIQVPRRTEYLTQFRSSPRLAIQEIAGRRTVAENAFFNSVSIFSEVFKKPNHIFKADDLRIDVNSFTEIEDYLYDKDYFAHPDNPGCYRYIHLDIAEKKDRFGLASVYSKPVVYTSAEGDSIKKRTYYIDFCLGISSSGGNAVDLLKVLEFVYGLKKKGYPVKKVSTDSHQGELARQILRRNGVQTEYLSVEKDKEAYYFLKNLILTQTINGFYNPLLTRELAGLRETTKRVEKSKSTTDDLCDALAGACYLAYNDPFYLDSNDTITELLERGHNIAGFAKNNNDAMIKFDVNKFGDLGYLSNLGLYIPERPKDINQLLKDAGFMS